MGQFDDLIPQDKPAKKAKAWQGQDFSPAKPSMAPLDSFVSGTEQYRKQRSDDITAQSAKDFSRFNKQHPYLGMGISALQGAAQGAAAGLGDRLSAGARALLGKGSYEDELARQRGWMGQSAEENPLTHDFSAIGGALAAPGFGFRLGGAGRMGGLASGAATGGAYGAIGGAASAPDWRDLGDTASRTATGGALGAAIGAPIGALTRGRSLTGAPDKDLVKHAPPEQRGPFLGGRITGGMNSGGFKPALKEQEAIPDLLKSSLGDAFNLGSGEAGKRTELAARESLGVHRAENIKSEKTLGDWLDYGRNLKFEDMLAASDYIEGKGALPKHLQEGKAGFDAIKAVGKKDEELLKQLPEHMRPQFVKDYMSHVLQPPPGKAGVNAGGGRKGSSYFTQGRTFKSLREAVEAGYMPKTTNLFESAIYQTVNQNTWMARKEMFAWARDQGLIRYATDKAKRPIPKDLRPLDFDFGKGAGNKPYAPRDVANVLNNLYSEGLYGGEGGMASAMRGLAASNNLFKAAKLGLSGFHIGMVAGEGFVSELGQAAGELAAGHPLMAAKSVGRSLALPIEAATPWKGSRSARGLAALKGEGKPDPVFDKIADLGRRVNFPYKPSRTQLFQEGAALSAERPFGEKLGSRFKQGGVKGVAKGFAGDVKQVGKEYADAWKNKDLKKALNTTIRAVGSPFSASMSPIFEHYVPMVKTGAFFDKMESFMKLNPTATDQELLGFAARLSDSLDNRMGELARDHLFWKNKVNDAGQLLFLSPTWQIGTIREIGGAIPDSLKYMMRGPERLQSGAAMKGGQLKPEYLAGLLVGGMVMGSTYEYLMTGKAPKTPTVTPQTGGRVPLNPQYTGGVESIPELAQLPVSGYWKDILSLHNSVNEFKRSGLLGGDALAKEVTSKFSPLAGLAWQNTVGGGKGFDSNGVYGPLYDYSRGLPGVLEGVGDQLKGQMDPISHGIARNMRGGTNIPEWQRWLGVRPASSYLQDPIGYRGVRDYFNQQDKEKKEDAAIRARGKQEGTPPAQINEQIKRAKKAREGEHRLTNRRQAEAYVNKYGGPQ